MSDQTIQKQEKPEQEEPETLSLTPEAAAVEISVRAIVTAAQHNRRVVVGIAGGPGSGKSTIAADVIGELNDRIDGSAARVPMDGFHMRHAKLQELGLVEIKGAPETFEPHNFIAFLKKLKNAKSPMPVPSYSRKTEDVVDDAFSIPSNVPILVVEGNYLLLDRVPWRDIKPLLDFAIYIDVPRDKVKARLLKRHAEHGLFTEERNLEHVEKVDLANYDLVSGARGRADLVINLITDA